MLRSRWLALVSWLLLALAAAPDLLAARSQAGLGASDAFGTGFASLSDSQRRELFRRVIPVLADLGVARVRLTFGENDTPFAWGDIVTHLDEPRLYTLDELIGTLTAAGIEPVIVLSAKNDADHAATTLLPKDGTAWKQFVKLIVERYDGDVDFGVTACDTELGGPYPDIDASGKCSSYDAHSAADSLRQTWADRHVVRAYQIEDAPIELFRAGNIPPEQYGQLVALTVPWMRSLVPAGLDLQVILGGVRFAIENRLPYVQALAPLGTADAAARPDAADVFAVVDEGEWLTGEAFQAAVTGAKSFPEWLSSAGLKDLPFQVGRFTASAGTTSLFPWQDGAGPKGTCHGRFCSERSQAESLVKGLTRMTWKHPAPVFLANVLEYVGQGTVDDDWAWHGLLVERGDSPITTTDLRPRAAATVLTWLTEQAPGLAGGSLVEVFPVPANAHAWRVEGADVPTWIAWYDWVKEVPDGEDYLGITKNVEIVEVPTPAVRITSLFPAQPGDPWTPGDVVPATEGTVRFKLGQDMLLVQGVDQAVPDEPEADTVTADAVDDATGTEVVEEDGGGGGGCSAGSATPAPLGLALLALAVVLRSRSRGPVAR